MWIDVGDATVMAEDVKYIDDVRAEHGSGFARGMKSVIHLKSGGWLYARYGRSVIIRRIRQATEDATPPAAR